MKCSLNRLTCALAHILVILNCQEQIFGMEERQQGSYGHANLLSFRPLGKSLGIGLDFTLPFINVPIKRYKDGDGNPSALMNINTAALILGGVVSSFSLIVAHILRSLGLTDEKRPIKTIKSSAETSLSHKRDDANRRVYNIHAQRRENKQDISYTGHNARQLFDHFKLVYKNDTGERIEMTLPSLFARIEDTFLQNEVDIVACVHKSLCATVQKARKNVHLGRATSAEKILDGFSSYPWLLDALLPYEELRLAIDAGKESLQERNCAQRYPNCRWHAATEKLSDLIQTYVRFS